MRAAWIFAYNLIDRAVPNGLSLYTLGAGLLAAGLAPCAFQESSEIRLTRGRKRSIFMGIRRSRFALGFGCKNVENFCDFLLFRSKRQRNLAGKARL